jgi:hypothetical protein
VRDLYELLFCPIHGIFRPSNWPLFAVWGAGPLIVIKSWLGYVSRIMHRPASNAQYTENQERTAAMTYEDVAASIAVYTEKRRKK